MARWTWRARNLYRYRACETRLMRSRNRFADRSLPWWVAFVLLVVGGVGGQSAVNLVRGMSLVEALLSTIFGMLFVAVVIYLWGRRGDHVTRP
jgi:hypothetical protein